MHLFKLYFIFLLSVRVVCVQTDTELHSECCSLERRRNNLKLNNACFRLLHYFATMLSIFKDGK
jgi:hypothetical protein